MWMFFIVEAVVFCTYNFKRRSYSYNAHSLFRWSIALAIIYFLVYILLTLWNFYVSSRAMNVLDSESWKRRWGFVYEGLERGFLQRIFQFVQYLIYFLWALFLTIIYPNAAWCISLHLILIFILFIYVLVFRPAHSSWWKFEQIGIHFFLLLAQILISTLLYDDDRRHMSGSSRWRMGYAIAFFMFFIIVWNCIVLWWKLIEYMLKCNAARLTGVLPGVGIGGLNNVGVNTGVNGNLGVGGLNLD